MPISREASKSAAVVGMMPCEPTPTGMWSNSDWASSSFLSWTSASVCTKCKSMSNWGQDGLPSSALGRTYRSNAVCLAQRCMVAGEAAAERRYGKILSTAGEHQCLTRLVRMSLTPQLMSKPTPPGDTTASGSPMSNAATFPIAKPYPECMSGSAMDFCIACSGWQSCHATP